MVYAKEYKYYKNALRAERNLKKRTRKEKEEIIRNYDADPHRFVTHNFATTKQGMGTGANLDMGIKKGKGNTNREL